MEGIIFIVIGVILLLVLMFLVSKFLTREQSYERAMEQKKQELENIASEQKSGKQKRRHVYSKHSDKQKQMDDKQKASDDKHKTVDDKQKSPDHKQKPVDDKPKSSDEKQKSPNIKQKSTEDKVTKSDASSKSNKSGTTPASDVTASPSKKRVEIVPQVETIDSETDLLAHKSATPEKTLLSHPSRSILVNKDEKSLIIEAEDIPETFHPRPAPVDELDRKQYGQLYRTSGTTSTDDAEHLREKSEPKRTPSPAGKLHKKKKKGKSNDSAEGTEGKLISLENLMSPGREKDSELGNLVRKDSKDLISATVKLLESNEIDEDGCKSLIKALEHKDLLNVALRTKKEVCSLNQEDGSATELLKRQVKDLETSLQKEKSALAFSNAQVMKLKEELVMQHQKSEIVTKNLQTVTAKQNQEVNELRNRLELASKLHEQERRQFQAHLESLQLEVVKHSATIQALMEENVQLKENVRLGQLLDEQVDRNVTLLRGPFVDNNVASQCHLEDNIKQFENQFEEMVAKQEMEKMKEDNETIVLSLRKHIEDLKAEVLERDNQIQLLQLYNNELKPVDQNLVCEKTLHQITRTIQPSLASCDPAVDGMFTVGDRKEMQNLSPSQEERIQELGEQLLKQKQKNDDLRRKNWKMVEALSELENELQSGSRLKRKAEAADNVEHLTAQLQSVQKEKANLLRLKEDQEITISSMQNQIANLREEIERNSKHQKIVLRQNLGREGRDHDADIIKLEESLNRQIQKNDDLRRRNWKTMEALSELEKRDEDNMQLKSQFEDQLRSLQKEKLDLEILNKGLHANLATCVHQVEQAEKHSSETLSSFKKVTNDYNSLKMTKMSTDGLNDSQLKRITQLESFVSEKNARIKQLEDDLLTAQKTLALDLNEIVSLPSAGTLTQTLAESQSTALTESPKSASDEVNRKEAMVITRIQETTKWDLSQLVLELDTKSAEVMILQSLLEQNENALHDLKEEKSKTLEFTHHMQQALKEKDITIELLQAQLKNCTAAESPVAVGHLEENSFKEVLLKKDSEIEQLKAELLHYQSQIKDLETHGRLSLSPVAYKESISEDGREVFDSISDSRASIEKHEKTLVEIKSLQDQVKHYQDVLGETVGMLSSLQSSVEQEEKKWLQKFEKAEERTAVALQEAQQLREELQMLKQSS